MAIIKLVLWRIRRQWLSSLLLFVQMVFFFYAMLLVISCIQEYTYTIRMLDSIDGIEQVTYWTPDIQNPEEDDIDAAEKAILDTGGFSAVGHMSTGYFISSGKAYDLQLYSKELAHGISLPLASGKWLGDTASGLPALVVDSNMGKTYPIGSIVNAEFDLESGGQVCIRYEVVGILDMHGYIFDFSSGGNALRAGDFFNSLENYAIACIDSMPDGSFVSAWESAILFPSSSASNEQIKAGRLATLKYGCIQSFASVRNLSANSILYQLGYIGPMSAMLALLGLIGIAISIAASGYLNECESGVYFMCGLNRMKLCMVECIRLSISAALAALLTCALTVLGVFSLYTTENTCIITLLIGVVMLGAAMACAVPCLYRHDFANAFGRD